MANNIVGGGVRGEGGEFGHGCEALDEVVKSEREGRLTRDSP